MRTSIQPKNKFEFIKIKPSCSSFAMYEAFALLILNSSTLNMQALTMEGRKSEQRETDATFGKTHHAKLFWRRHLHLLHLYVVILEVRSGQLVCRCHLCRMVDRFCSRATFGDPLTIEIQLLPWFCDRVHEIKVSRTSCCFLELCKLHLPNLPSNIRWSPNLRQA